MPTTLLMLPPQTATTRAWASRLKTALPEMQIVVAESADDAARAVGEARKLMPQSVLLLPGVGAQGASPLHLERAWTSGPASALVAASRSIITCGGRHEGHCCLATMRDEPLHWKPSRPTPTR